MDPKPGAKPNLTSWNDFCRLVLEIIAEQSPCSKPTLLVLAAARGLQRFGDGFFGGLNKLLGRCVQELNARALVHTDGERLLITPTRRAESEDIFELTAELHEVEDILELMEEVPTNETQLQTQAQVRGSAKPAREPKSIALSTGSAEDQDIFDLTPELELSPSKLDEPPTGQRQLQTQAGANGEPTWDEILASAANAEEDILYLTPELELRPSVHPFQEDEAQSNRTRRTCEPTREEMIAAMRRFISDE